ncbi:MAG: GtrA family protein [Rikenellaceae bacterium]
MDLQDKVGREGRLVCAVRWVVDLFYVGIIRRIVPIDLWRWAVCGVGNYILLDSILYYIIYHYVVALRYVDFGVVVISPHVLSLIILFPITFSTGFWLGRNVAFGATHQVVSQQLWRYALSIVGSFLINYCVMKFLVEYCGVWATPSKIVGSVITSLYSFLAARYFTFRRGVKNV